MNQIISTIICGFAIALVTYYLTKRKDYITLQRQKLEQLSLVARKYLLSLQSHYASYLSAMEKTVPGEAFQSELVTGSADEESYETAVTLQSIYFPQLADYFHAVARARSRAEVQIAILCDKQPPSKRHLEGCMRCLAEDHETIQSLGHELIVRTRDIASRLNADLIPLPWRFEANPKVN